MYKPREQNKISYAVSLTNSFEEVNQAMYQSLNDVTSRLYDNIQKKVNTIGSVLKRAQDTTDKGYEFGTERLFSVINDYFQNVFLMGHGSSYGNEHKAKKDGKMNKTWYAGAGSKIATKSKKERKKEQQARKKAEKKKRTVNTSF